MDTAIVSGPNVYVLPPGEFAIAVHPGTDCEGRECVVHNPSPHSMRNMALTWRSDRGIFERQCPHGVGHPDPDQKAYWRELAKKGREDSFGGWAVEPEQDADEFVSAQMVHGCCAHRCCVD